MRALITLLLLPALLQAQMLTGFPSLSIPASARGWAMGNTGIASAIENQALSYNIAQSAFTQNFHQASVHYMPWLPGVSNDAQFMHADYLASVGSSSAFGVMLNYLNLGTVAIRDDNGATLGLYHASEFNLGTSYALQLGGGASLGAAFRFFGNQVPAGAIPNTYGVCGDLGYYQSCTLSDASKTLSWGAVVLNLGGNTQLPSTAGIGVAYAQHDEGGNQLTVTADANRLLRDDWKGMRISAGAEYGFAEQFFLRGGVSLESKEKGNRKYISVGAGYKGFVSDQSWGLDLFWLVPIAVSAGVSPFQNSYGLTLKLNLGSFQ